jgi:hypothetical protein
MFLVFHLKPVRAASAAIRPLPAIFPWTTFFHFILLLPCGNKKARKNQERKSVSICVHLWLKIFFSPTIWKMVAPLTRCFH